MSLSINSIAVPKCTDAFNKVVNVHYKLQQAVLSNLPSDQKYLRGMTHDEWSDFLKNSHHHIINAHDGDLLVGQLCVLLPDKRHPDVDMVDMVLPSETPEEMATFRTIMTHPHYRGHNLMHRLMSEAQSYSESQGRKHLLGTISRDNPQSWSQFLKQGLLVTGAGIDPSDNCDIYYAHKNLTCADTFNQDDEIYVDTDIDIQDLNSLFGDGYRGVAGEKQNGKYTGRLILQKLAY